MASGGTIKVTVDVARVAPADLDRRFSYHAPSAERAMAHAEVRAAFREMAERLTDALPPGREVALVLTHLEEAMFWANAALARADETA
jgi:hypothetical protein